MTEQTGKSFGLANRHSDTSETVFNLLDHGRSTLSQRHAAANGPLDAARGAAEKWGRDLRRRVQPRHVKTGTVLADESAYEYLVQLRSETIRAGTQLIDLYAPYDWIVLIRSTDLSVLASWGLADDEDGGAASLQRVMENLAAASTRVDAAGLTAASLLDQRVSMRLARLIFLSAWVDRFEQQIRSTVKGVKYLVGSGGSHTHHESGEIGSLLNAFDVRNSFSLIERWQEDLTSPRPLADGLPMIAAYPFRSGEAKSRSWLGPLPNRSFVERINRFTVRTFRLQNPSTSSLPQGAIATFPEPEEIVALVCFAHAVYRWVSETHDTAGIQIPQRGFLESTRAETLTAIHEGMLSLDLQTWLRERQIKTPLAARVLELMENLYVPLERSLPGRLVYSVPELNAIRIDLVTLAWHLAISLRLDPRGGGPLVNVDADNFELIVQDAIERSEFPTPPALLKLRGKDLRIDGKPVTDLDALLVINQQLFLISCKNVLPRLQYLAGDFRTVRNAQSRVDDSLREWATRIQRIVDHPVGDNFDFSGYLISGFVVTPELIFSPDPLAWQEVSVVDKRSLCFYGLDDIDHLVMVLEMAAWPNYPQGPEELPAYMQNR